MKTRQTAAQHVLQTIREAGHVGIGSMDLMTACGPAARARVSDLMAQGWQIQSEQSGDCEAIYRLVSETRLQPRQLDAGATIRHTSTSGWTVQTHGEATRTGVYAPELLSQAAQAALRAYMDVLGASAMPGTSKSNGPATRQYSASIDDDDDTSPDYWRDYGDFEDCDD